MRFFAVLLFLAASLVSAQPTYTTGFEDFVLGDVQGQDGWGHLSNSPTGGTIVDTPVHAGGRSLRLFTRDAGLLGVASHLYSATVDPPAGEAGSTLDGAVVADPETHFSASLWYRTPDAPVVSTRPDGRIAELNASSKGPDADDATKRYAQVRIFNNGDGRVRVEIGWYTNASSAFTAAVVAFLDWGAWYRFDYLIHFIDGLNGSAPNDRFSLTIFDAGGVQLGSACGSTWETAWKSDPTFGGGLAAQAVNGFDFWSHTGPTGTTVGYIDDFTISSFSAAPFAVAITGATSVCPGATTTLSSSVAATTYTWRNAAGDTVATTPTFDAPAGTYTLTVTNALCETSTSAASFTVTTIPAPQVTIAGRGYVIDAADRDLLTAQVTAPVTDYTWRNAANEIVGTGTTFSAPAGTYTVTVTGSCGPVTSAPFTVTLLATPTVPTVGEWGLMALMVTLAMAALVRTR